MEFWNVFFLQFSVLARDNGSPVRFSASRATVRITVFRNLFAPVFQGIPYAATLNFNSPSGNSVKQVNATDADAQVYVFAWNEHIFISYLKGLQ